ncbi:MAG: flagellar FliJ family protein [Agarilytica sp.]
MPRASKRLVVVADMAKRKEDEAAAILADRQKKLEEEKQRSGDLLAYYSEYETKFQQRTQGLRAESLMQNREFLQQLANSCEIQRSEVARIQQEVDIAIAFWHQCHLKHEKLREHIAKLSKDEDSALEALEQKSVDEWVAQNFSRNKI